MPLTAYRDECLSSSAFVPETVPSLLASPPNNQPLNYPEQRRHRRPNPALSRVLPQAPPDLRAASRHFRRLDFLCDVTLVFNEDDDSEDGDRESPPETMRAHKLILGASSTYFYEVFGKVSSSGSLKLWLPPPILRRDMEFILDWMYGVDVIDELLEMEVGALRHLIEAADVLQLTSFVQSLQSVIDRVCGSALPDSFCGPLFDPSDSMAATGDETPIKTEVESEFFDVLAPSQNPKVRPQRKRKLDPCLAELSRAVTKNIPKRSKCQSEDSSGEIERRKYTSTADGLYRCFDCKKTFSRLSSLKFHRVVAHNDNADDLYVTAFKKQKTPAAIPQSQRPSSRRPTSLPSRKSFSSEPSDEPLTWPELPEFKSTPPPSSPLLQSALEPFEEEPKPDLETLMRSLCARELAVSAGDFYCCYCPTAIKGGKLVCEAVAKHMYRAHGILCRPYALPCEDCNYVSWNKSLAHHLRTESCKFYSKEVARPKFDYVMFRGKSIRLSSLRVDYTFLTMKRDGEWECPEPSCSFSLHKESFVNSSLISRNAAAHMLEEHLHLLEFYACFCYLCPVVTFAQASLNQHISSHAKTVEREEMEAEHKQRLKGLAETSEAVASNQTEESTSPPRLDTDCFEVATASATTTVTATIAPTEVSLAASKNSSSSDAPNLISTDSTANEKIISMSRNKQFSTVVVDAEVVGINDIGKDPIFQSQEVASVPTLSQNTAVSRHYEVPAVTVDGNATRSVINGTMMISGAKTSNLSIQSTSSVIASNQTGISSSNQSGTFQRFFKDQSMKSTPSEDFTPSKRTAPMASDKTERTMDLNQAALTITKALAEKKGKAVEDSEEVNVAIQSLILSLAESGVVPNRTEAIDDEMMQIEVDSPGHPSVLLQLPVAALNHAASKLNSTSSSLSSLTTTATNIPVPIVSSPKNFSWQQQRGSLPNGRLSLGASRVPDPLSTSSVVAKPSTTCSVPAILPKPSSPSFAIPFVVPLKSPLKNQKSMTGSLLGNADDGLTLITSNGPIRLPPGTRQFEGPDGDLQLQLPPGHSLADIGL